ncbi:MAG: enamine deaminase RidA [Rhodospirillaceae bacterium]|nr:enamine deaminase RidA [Rhodospirillaceae bacterium]|tara:strand:- start:2007 stop:2414 length:408 start_codon:yes stop_codon:yes gene_type:complete
MTNNAVPIHLDPDPFRQFNISAGFQVGDLLFLSGHVPIDSEGNPVRGDFDEQAELTFKNLEKTLLQAGSSLEQVIKLTIYVTNIRVQRTKIMELRRKWFKPPYPADTLVEVSALGDPSRLLEIDAIALVSGQIKR